MRTFRLLPILALPLFACGGGGGSHSGGSTTSPVTDHLAVALGFEIDASGDSVDHLVTFHTNSPSTFQTDVAITGVDTGDRVVAIDQRPSTGGLYGIGIGGTLYTLDPTTGVATKLGTTNPIVDKFIADIDFDPTTDQVRVVGYYVNARLDPATGAVVANETVGSAQISGLAYAPSGTLYAYSLGTGQRERLLKIATPSSGVPSSYTSATLPFFGTETDTDNPLNEEGMDISADGKTAILTSFGLKGSSIVLVDLASGAQRFVGTTPAGMSFQTINVAFFDPVAQTDSRKR